jgi:hypothetical protein
VRCEGSFDLAYFGAKNHWKFGEQLKELPNRQQAGDLDQKLCQRLQFPLMDSRLSGSFSWIDKFPVGSVLRGV